MVDSLTVAYLLDLLLGDPQWFPHPVRFIGFLISKGEKFLRKLTSHEFLAGMALAFSLIAGSFLSIYFLLKFISGYSLLLSRALEILLLYFCLSTKDLAVECGWVQEALKSEDLALARKKLSWIVGRDTDNMDEKEVVRGTVETVAENTVDGIIAPLFYAALGGAPLAIAYKTINTLDSMIGHKNEKYIYFGRTAAQIDTWANWLPARLSGLLFPICAGLIGFSVKGSYKAAWSQGVCSLVPNSAIPEAAMAGALQVQLGGLNSYQGRTVETPKVGYAVRSLSIENIGEAIKIAYVASALFFLLSIGLRILMGR